MLLLLEVRLIGEWDLYCMSSEVLTGMPKSKTALRDVMTYVQSAETSGVYVSAVVLHMHGALA